MKRSVSVTRLVTRQSDHGISCLLHVTYLDEFASANVFQDGTLLLSMLFKTFGATAYRTEECKFAINTRCQTEGFGVDLIKWCS